MLNDDFFMSNRVMAILIAAVIAASLFAVSGNNVSAVKCEDIKGVEKWDDQPSQHNEPSEKKFRSLVFEKEGLPCEISECYDHNKCTGTIEEGEWKKFTQTAAYMGTTEEVQDCFKDRYDLPDNGDKALQAYEYHHCQIGSY